MLEALKPADHSGIVYRLAGRRSVERLARKYGITDDADMEDIRQAIGEESLAKVLLTDPFQRKDFLPLPFGGPTRFGDGTFPVFYSAERLETSEAELRYHRERDAVGDPTKQFALHMWAFQCRIEGRAIDLRPELAQWSWLRSIETCNANCQALGREASTAGDVDAFQAPSARDNAGTTVPVFQADALSSPVIECTTIFAFDAGTGKVSVRRLGLT